MKIYSILQRIVLLAFLFGSAQLFSQEAYKLSLGDGMRVTGSDLSNPVRQVASSNMDKVTITYSFDYLDVVTKSVKEGNFDFISLPGFGSLKEVGAPSIPARTDFVAVPANAKPVVRVVSSKYKEFTGYYLHPELEPARDTEGSPEPVFEMNEKLYSTDNYFPNSIIDIVDVQVMKEVPLAMVQFKPVQFNPVQKTIKVYTEVTYEISFQGDKSSFIQIGQSNSRTANEHIKGLVLNPEMIVDGKDSKSIDKNYIIITHNEYLEPARKLANWKTLLGYGVEIVSKPSWTSNEVKNEIHDRYDNWDPKPDYFVIIGDHDGDYAVPGEIKQCPDGEDFATDLYYGCMDGGSDYFPDMARGRIAVSSLEEANIVVDKIINYEYNPVEEASFYQNGVNCAQYQDDDHNGYADRRFCHTSEDVRDYLINEQGYTVDRIYFTDSEADVTTLHYNQGYYSTGQLLPDELRNASFDWNGGASEITQAINAGKFYVLHRDHGYSGATGWAHPYYTLNSMDALANGDHLPVVFSINCHTGEFQLYSFAEKFIRMENKGAVGVVGAAYYSYSGYNDALVSGMFDAIWPEPGLTFQFGYGGVTNPPASGPPPAVRTMGDVVDYGLVRMVETWDGGYNSNKYQHELFHYFGDPAMKIWTSNPHDSLFSANYPATINCEEAVFSITDCNVDGALVTLVQNNEVVGIGTISGTSADVNYELITNGEVIIAFSKENHKTFIDTLQTTGTCSYAPEVITGTASNISFDYAEIAGEIITDNGESVSASGVVLGLEPNPEVGSADVLVFETNPLVNTGEYTVIADALEGSTNYYYRAFATNAIGTNYGLNESFSTYCSPVTDFPYTYDFENDFSEDCWLQEYVEGDNIDWIVTTGNGPTVSYAYSGETNIRFYDNDEDDDKTKIYTPYIQLGSSNYAALTFYHIQDDFFNYQDELRVFYRNHNTSEWTQIAEYTGIVDDWTKQSVELPDLTDLYQIAFEGNAKMAYGVAVDYMQVHTSNVQPVVETSVTAIEGFGNVEVGAESVVKSYTVSGDNLLSDYVVTAPDGFLVSLTNDGEFTQSVIIESGVGVIPETDIYVKFVPEESIQYSSNILHTSPGATEIEVAVNGVGVPSMVTSAAKEDIRIYPNPAKDFIEIDYATDSSYRILLIDATGSKVGEWNSETRKFKIDISEYNSGLYYVKIYDNNVSIIKKMIVE